MSEDDSAIKGHSLPLTKGVGGTKTTTVATSLPFPVKFYFEGTQNSEQEFHHGIFSAQSNFKENS